MFNVSTISWKITYPPWCYLYRLLIQLNLTHKKKTIRLSMSQTWYCPCQNLELFVYILCDLLYRWNFLTKSVYFNWKINISYDFQVPCLIKTCAFNELFIYWILNLKLKSFINVSVYAAESHYKEKNIICFFFPKKHNSSIKSAKNQLAFRAG